MNSLPRNTAVRLLMLLTTLLLIPASARSHPVPDGQIKRGIQLVVREDRIELRYQIGLNENMARQQLEDAEQPPNESGGEADAISRCRNMYFGELPDALTVTIDGQPTELSPVRADLIRQHHANIECVYEVDIQPTTTPKKLNVADNNFANVPGSHEMAIRARGDIELVDTTARESLGRREPTIGPKPAAPKPTEQADESESPQRRTLEAYFCLPTESR